MNDSPFVSRSSLVPSPGAIPETVSARDSVPLPGYLSAQALADARLPGLPSTKRNINAYAARAGWRFIDRVGQGGGRLYATADLPTEALAALQAQRIEVATRARTRGRPAGYDWAAANPAMADAVIAILATRRLSAARVRELLAHDFPVLPAHRTLQRFIARIEHEKAAVLASVRNPDAYNSKHRLALGRADRTVTYAHELWEIDTTPADVMTKDGRKDILGIIDRYSRRGALMVCESESAQSVRRFLVETILAWGVMPAALLTDNGSGFINASIRSALEALGIEHRIAPPGSPQVKPHIERLFGTFTRERAELLGGYIGHSVAEAQALRGAAKKRTGRALIVPELTAEQLQDILNNWLDGTYHVRTHSALRMSPRERWMLSPVPALAAPDENVLRLALSALVGTRTVGKRGIRWKGGRYWSQSLLPWIGRDIVVRRDEDDLGALLCFAPDGTFIDTAVNQERSGLTEADFAAEARRQQAAHDAAARAELRAKQRAFSFERARDALLAREAEAAGKLVHFPQPTAAASTPTLDSLSDALAGRGAAPMPDVAPIAPLDNVTRLPVAPRAAPVITAADRAAEADQLVDDDAAGVAVDPARLAWAHRYRATPEYRAHAAVRALQQPTRKD